MPSPVTHIANVLPDLPPPPQRAPAEDASGTNFATYMARHADRGDTPAPDDGKPAPPPSAASGAAQTPSADNRGQAAGNARQGASPPASGTTSPHAPETGTPESVAPDSASAAAGQTPLNRYTPGTSVPAAPIPGGQAQAGQAAADPAAAQTAQNPKAKIQDTPQPSTGGDTASAQSGVETTATASAQGANAAQGGLQPADPQQADPQQSGAPPTRDTQATAPKRAKDTARKDDAADPAQSAPEAVPLSANSLVPAPSVPPIPAQGPSAGAAHPGGAGPDQAAALSGLAASGADDDDGGTDMGNALAAPGTRAATAKGAAITAKSALAVAKGAASAANSAGSTVKDPDKSGASAGPSAKPAETGAGATPMDASTKFDPGTQAPGAGAQAPAAQAPAAQSGATPPAIVAKADAAPAAPIPPPSHDGAAQALAPPAHSPPSTQGQTDFGAAASALSIAPRADASNPTDTVRLALGPGGGLADLSALDDLALKIAAKSAAGDSQFQIRLDPPDLGRIDISLHVDAQGNAQASLSADKPQTLDLLQRDAPNLERALRDVGLDLGGGLAFSLKGDGQPAMGRESRSGGRARALAVGAVDSAKQAAIPHAVLAATNSGAARTRLDIRV